MLKKYLITGGILVSVGIVGLIPSTIYTVPYFVNYRNQIEVQNEKINVGQVVFEQKAKPQKLVLNSTDMNIEIRKENTDTVKILKHDYDNHRNFDVEASISGTTLKINQKDLPMEKREISSLIDEFMKNSFGRNLDKLTIIVPEAIELELNNQYGNIVLQDNVANSSIKMMTDNGDITLNHQSKVNTVIITSQNSLNLNVQDFMNIKEINIKGSDVNLSSYDNQFDFNSSALPQEVKISCTGLYLNSPIPVAKKLTINQVKGGTQITLPAYEFTYNVDLLNEGPMSIYDNVKQTNIVEEYNEENSNKKNVFQGKLTEQTPSTEVYNIEYLGVGGNLDIYLDSQSSIR